MSAPPSNDDPLPDDLDDLGGTEPSPGDAASDPESARREAEEALSEIEALADLDEDLGADSSGGEPTADRASETAAGASTEASGSARGRPEDQCENCGALLHGPYCSECGQKAAERIVPVWHMINEALEAVFELDLRVLRTLPKFLFLPGRLTKEYLNGRRKRYIRPFRLYLFSTFVLFAAVAFTTTGGFGLVLDPQGAVRLNPPDTEVTAGRVSDTTAMSESAASFFGDPAERERVAKKLASDSSSVTVGLFDDPAANRRAEQMLRTKVAEAVRNPQEFVGDLIDRGPYLMFLMLPVFALLLKLLYIRRGRLYMEHLIFSLHVHALAFFAFTVSVLLDQSEIGWLQTTAVWISASPFLYLILAMSHVYDQGFFKSSVKALILFTIYSIILAIGFAILLLLAILYL